MSSTRLICNAEREDFCGSRITSSQCAYSILTYHHFDSSCSYSGSLFADNGGAHLSRPAAEKASADATTALQEEVPQTLVSTISDVYSAYKPHSKQLSYNSCDLHHSILASWGGRPFAASLQKGLPNKRVFQKPQPLLFDVPSSEKEGTDNLLRQQ